MHSAQAHDLVEIISENAFGGGGSRLRDEGFQAPRSKESPILISRRVRPLLVVVVPVVLLVVLLLVG